MSRLDHVREKHWPALDGLRGTAILAVLICHYSALLPRTHPWLGVLENGWAGVDLFFVLSGFLITGILIDAKGSPHYFRNFYARRFLRIFPLYYGFLLVILGLLVILRFTAGPNEQIGGLWRAQPWLWSFTANYWLPTQRTWTVWTEMTVPLWSLSVEEQFYLAWPVVVLVFSPRALIRICVGVMIAALGLRLILTAAGMHYFTIYVITPTRADPLAAGALLAVMLRLPNGTARVRRLCKYAGPIALALILIGSRGFDPTHHPWLRLFLYTNLAIFFAALLFWAIDSTSWWSIPNRFYEQSILRTIGVYSYGIYIIHVPLYYLIEAAMTRWGLYNAQIKTWPAALAMIALNGSLTGAMAWAGFRYLETPALRLKRYFPRQ